MEVISILTMVYKPTNITGGVPPCTMFTGEIPPELPGFQLTPRWPRMSPPLRRRVDRVDGVAPSPPTARVLGGNLPESSVLRAPKSSLFIG